MTNRNATRNTYRPTVILSILAPEALAMVNDGTMTWAEAQCLPTTRHNVRHVPRAEMVATVTAGDAFQPNDETLATVADGAAAWARCAAEASTLDIDWNGFGATA